MQSQGTAYGRTRSDAEWITDPPWAAWRPAQFDPSLPFDDSVPLCLFLH
jgi:hypothetical protein